MEKDPRIEKLKKLMDEEKYEKALPLAKELAKEDIMEGLIAMGDICYARCENPDAGADPNGIESAEWLKKAALKGNADIAYELSETYGEGWGVDQDYDENFKWLKLAAEGGHELSQLKLAEDYRYGICTDPDSAKAIEWYKKAASWNDWSLLQIAEIYEKGEGNVPQDLDQAIEWYKKAEKRNCPEAADSLGNCFLDKKDYENARLWLEKAETNGSMNATFLLAEMDEKGLGAPASEKRALKRYKEAARTGSLEALETVVRHAFKEKGIIPTEEQIHKGCLKKTKKMDPRAVFVLGLRCEEDKQYEKAAGFYKIAANQGDWSALCHLGELYKEGKGVEKDEKKGNKLTRKGEKALRKADMAPLFEEFDKTHTRKLTIE